MTYGECIPRGRDAKGLTQQENTLLSDSLEDGDSRYFLSVVKANPRLFSGTSTSSGPRWHRRLDALRQRRRPGLGGCLQTPDDGLRRVHPGFRPGEGRLPRGGARRRPARCLP